MKIIVDVSNKELAALEHQTVCWNLCEKHNRMLNVTEADMFKFTQDCPKCRAINKKLREKVLHLWSKMVTAYLKASKRNGKPTTGRK